MDIWHFNCVASLRGKVLEGGVCSFFLNSIQVIAGVVVVPYLSNFEASAEHESQANGGARQLKNVRFLYLTVETR